MNGTSIDSLIAWIQSQANFINNIANNVHSLVRLIAYAAYIMGVAFAFKALHSLKMYGESRSSMSGHANMKEPLTYIIAATVLVSTPTVIKIFMNMTFGYSNVLAYAPVNSSNSLLAGLFGGNSPIGSALATIIQVIGAFTFVKGWLIIARSAGQGQGRETLGKAFMHIFGGILAMNIVGTVQIINNTLSSPG